MDELRFKPQMTTPRSARRLALLALLNCSAIIGVGMAPLTGSCFAGDSIEQQAQTHSELRSLLTDGWQQPTIQPMSPVEVGPLTDVVVGTLDSGPTMLEPALPPLAVHERVGRLVPIRIDSAQEIADYASEQRIFGLKYADIPAKTIESKSNSSTHSYQVPKLPAPGNTKTSRPVSSRAKGLAPPVICEANSNVSANKLDARPGTDDLLTGTATGLKTDVLRTLASNQGFGLFGTNRDDSTGQTATAGPVKIDPVGIKSSSNSPARSIQIESTIRTNKLGEIAAEQLRDARGRLHRGATHSAKRLTIQAIGNLVAVQDARQGDNENARHLDVALTAIRESADFGAKFGTLDQRSLRRLVVAHRTTVLKDQDLSHVTPMRATEAYLAVAREEIVMATAAVAMASDALVLLGQIESSIAPSSDTRSGAVALSLQQAAVEVDPANSHAWLQLGTTMLNEGLLEESIEVLSQSVQLHPSRQGYERLMAAAQQAQDVSLMQQCSLALQNPRLRRQLPVRQLNQEAFAAMYKPTNAIARNAATPKNTSSSEKSPTIAQPVSGKTKRFALLRSWVMPKKSNAR